MNIKLIRNSSNYTLKVNNFFGEETIIFSPNSHSSFSVDLINSFTGITLYFNFYDTELEIGKTFRGTIERRTISKTSIKDSIVETGRKVIMLDDKTLGLKFPFLFDKDSVEFMNNMENYFLENEQIRKITEIEIEIPELILFNNSYNIFNVGEQRIVINSETMFLKGYGIYRGSLRPFEDNRGSFYIEKISYNFKSKTTKFYLVSI